MTGTSPEIAQVRRDFDRITLTHGQVLETGGRTAFAKAFEFLG